jgi:hypothetical protein
MARDCSQMLCLSQTRHHLNLKLQHASVSDPLMAVQAPGEVQAAPQSCADCVCSCDVEVSDDLHVPILLACFLEQAALLWEAGGCSEIH